MVQPLFELALRLPKDERLRLIGELWESLGSDELPLSETQRAELDRRIADYRGAPDDGEPWRDVLSRIRVGR